MFIILCITLIAENKLKLFSDENLFELSNSFNLKKIVQISVTRLSCLFLKIVIPVMRLYVDFLEAADCAVPSSSHYDSPADLAEKWSSPQQK